MANICIFCGSRTGNDPIFMETSYTLGTILAKRGHTILYGGGSRGIMGAVARGALDNGGKVIGIITKFLDEKEREGRSFIESESLYIDDMSKRKTLLYGRADSIIVLPGGIGTLDEFFEVLTLKQLEQHQKPIGILNIKNYYNPLMEYMHTMVESGFLSVGDLGLILVRENIDELLDQLQI